MPEKLTYGMSFVKSSAASVASGPSYEGLSALSALVAAAIWARNKANCMYKHVFEKQKDKVLFLWTEINKSEEEMLKEVLEWNWMK